ncbi:MAG TPA: hypothetical protein VKT53_12740 [Candidatus Acidoferrum sp.]|nr:hypothetical protein [Candidatus Acidoferrum sp.]
MSATLVAVTVTVPATPGALNVAPVVVGFEIVPLVADHVTPAAPTSFVTVAVKFMLCPMVNPPRTGLIETDNPETTAGTTVIVAVPVREVSVTDFAVSVTVAGEGTAAGAMYVIATPEALEFVDNVPQVTPLHPVPESAQVTPLFCKSFVTVAVKVCVSPTVTLGVDGATLTPIAGTTVIVEEKLRVPSATEVALMATVAGAGTAAGAV